MPYGWIRQLTPAHWAGISCHGTNNGTSPAFGGYYPGMSPAFCGFGGTSNPQQFNVADDRGGAAGNIWPCKYICTVPFANDIAGPSLMTSWIASAETAANFTGGDWWSGAEGRARLATYTDAGSLSHAGSYASRNGAMTDITGNIDLAPGYNFVDMPVGTGAGLALPQWSFSNQAYDETGLIQRNLGCRFYAPDVEGLEMSFGAVGGSRVADHLNPDLVSDASIAAAIQWGDIDTVIIWLGANDFWEPDWIDHTRSLIARWTAPIRAAGRTPKVLLVCTYDIDGRTFSITRQQWDQDALAHEDPGTVSFYNLFKRAGSYEGLQQYMRGDAIHTNFLGACYFAGLINTDLVAALAEGTGGECGSVDFNCDGNLGTDLDIAAFFACMGGACPEPPCGSVGDFNRDGNLGTDADIEAFFRVLGGGAC